MRVEKSVCINYDKGIHTRVAAAIVKKISDIKKKYNVDVYISAFGKKVPLSSMILIVGLKIKKGDIVSIEVMGENEEIYKAIDEICEFLSQNEIDEIEKDELDNIINQDALTLEQIINSMANAVIAIDVNGKITLVNKAMLNILKCNIVDVLNKDIDEVIPNSILNIVRISKRPRLGIKVKINDATLLGNFTPIIIDNQYKGVLAIFEDISRIEKITDELLQVRQLKEELQVVLDTVQDGICIIDSEGNIRYVNDAYANIVGESKETIINKNILDISPNGVRARVLKTGERVNGEIIKKKNGVTIIANVNPIIVDNQLCGVISVIKDVTEINMLYEKLNMYDDKTKYLQDELMRIRKPNGAFSNFKGYSGKTIEVITAAEKAAKTNFNVLILGESGTGKEIIAEGIHYASNRANGPFVRVNCAAIPENLIESELFGYEKGAFTGAFKRKHGKFELANGGTIFLDEIGDLNINVQAKILRAIQNREIQRIGGEDIVKVDVRIIAATHKDLKTMVKEGKFREDLYYRLDVISINIPPLRERKEDIPCLLEHFINLHKGNKNIKGVDKKVIDALIRYDWPGNVRELENVVERILAFIDEKDFITLDMLPIYINKTDNNINKESNRLIKNVIINEIFEKDEILPWKEYEKIIIEKALKKYGSYNAAAKALGLTHRTVALKAKEYGIEKSIKWISR
ncbi:sigma 54-interacting transcriptional regulator [Thermobrachium celere]|uniref:HTH-type transcriptional regulatory protein TyrR n=1 Tax=Thermobrachium celere DSM 8682 TaxID=941824 RepID=R7RQ12_9CLOT|nr:sigma 54-interacting transcriptional regulator [Thermobrachium celere]CDF57441.1 Response regulator of zinc sigma-54-dependent two-component system [Thermobrachium celere DSM 8682]